jgi:hypothetical protein
MHGLQTLFRSGQIELGLNGLSMLPDVRFIPAYEHARFSATQRALARRQGGRQAVNVFDQGHRNFLEEAVAKTYLYGEVDAAQKYYKKARKLYDDVPGVDYSMPLPEFVSQRMQKDWNWDMATARGLISMMLQRGFRQGLAHGDAQTFQRFLKVAREAHTDFNEDMAGDVVPQLQKKRASLEPFDQMVVSTFANMMRSQSLSLFDRARIYQNAPTSLQRRAYNQFAQAVAKQTQAQGVPMQQLFPKPGQSQGQGQQPEAMLPGNTGQGNASQ